MPNPIDFEAIRAQRAADILHLNESDNGYCADCGSELQADNPCGCLNGAPAWLDYWGGLHTLDDGHPGSYDHQAVAGRDGDSVTLTCVCGAWAGTAPGDTDEEPADLFGRWEAHVYAATGRWETKPAHTINIDAIRSGSPVDTATVTALCDMVESLTEERDRYAEQLDDAVAQLAEAEAGRDRMRASLRAQQFVLWAELGITEARAQVRTGRRLKDKLHTDPDLCEAWEVFRDLLDAAISADLAGAADLAGEGEVQ